MNSFKYAHLADLHLGSWRDEKMRSLSTKAFLQTIDQCVIEKVDFILFAGDLFNTSLPSVDILKIVTKKLKELQQLNIPLYVIAGSHDFSPSGKTMIDVLENAGLLTNVCKGTINQETKKLELKITADPSTGAKITGVLGRKGMLDSVYYENLSLEALEKEEGYKIFMFHTTLTELLPEHLQIMESQPISLFPKGFNYYAGGHIHHPTKKEITDFGTVTYTGALFPNNFQEMEKYSKGNYYIIDVQGTTQNIRSVPIEIMNHVKINFDCSHKSVEVVQFELRELLEQTNVENCIVTLRLHGTLASGKVTDIPYKELYDILNSKKAYFIMRNTSKLLSPEFEEISMSVMDTKDIENAVIQEHIGSQTIFSHETDVKNIKHLLHLLHNQKKEGQTVSDFETTMQQEIDKVLELELEE